MVARKHLRKYLIYSLTIIAFGGATFWYFSARDRELGAQPEQLLFETRSKFSHIKVMEQGSLRTMYFVRENGDEFVESTIDMAQPQKLIIDYTQSMFSSLLINNRHQSCLLIGLGGGAMVNFLNYYFPETKLDAVEIDPTVIEIAYKYFGFRPNKRTRVINADAFDFISNTREKYDAIYLDAFLKPSKNTDNDGMPLRLKTKLFYERLKDRLAANGLVVFNINASKDTQAEIEGLRQAFPNIYVFSLDRETNFAVVASTDKRRLAKEEIFANAKAIHTKGDFLFSFEAIARTFQSGK